MFQNKVEDVKKLTYDIQKEETTRKDPFKEAAAGGGKTLNLIGLTLTAAKVGGRLF